MIEEANKLIPLVKVRRTKTSPYDTLGGILGEFIFAEYFYGNWKKNLVSKNKGKIDFPDIEIKTSIFPMNDKLNLLIREDYFEKRKPKFYVQIIIDNDNKNIIPVGTPAFICGYAKREDVGKAPKKDFGSKFGKTGGYSCHYLPITTLKPIEDLKRIYFMERNEIFHS